MLEQNEVINASICLSDIPKDCIVKASNGKLYLNICVNRKREKDKYGYDSSVSVSQTKERKAAGEKICYLGNGRHVSFSGEVPATSEDIDKLPF